MRQTKPKIDWGNQLSEPGNRIKTFVAYKAPDPSRFDPMKEPFWTLPVTLAWIIWRSPDWVRTQWEYYDFYLRDLNRHSDKSRIDSGLKDLNNLALWTTDDCVPQTFIQNGLFAKADLRRHLQSGNLVATGVPSKFSERRVITTTEWLDIDLFNRDGLEDSIGSGPLRFNEVVTPSNEVLRIWPAIVEASVEKFNSPAAYHADAADKADTQELYQWWIELNPPSKGRRPPDRDEDLEFMRSQIECTIREVRLLRKLAPKSWKKPGRPPKIEK